MNSDAYLTTFSQKKKHSESGRLKRSYSYDVILSNEVIGESIQKRVKMENQYKSSDHQNDKQYIVKDGPKENVVTEFLLQNRESK